MKNLVSASLLLFLTSMMSIPAFALPTHDNLVGRVRGQNTNWEVASLSEPVTTASTYEHLNTTWPDPVTLLGFAFEYHASTGISSFTVDGVGTVYSDDIGLTGYGFENVYLQAIARDADTLTISNILFNGSSVPDFTAPGDWDGWSRTLYSGTALDDIVVSGTFSATGLSTGSDESTKFQVRIDGYAGSAGDSGDIYSGSAHRSTWYGVNRSGAGHAKGDCAHCHETFSSATCGANWLMFFAPNNPTSQTANFCLECHKGTDSVQADSFTNQDYGATFGGGIATFTGIYDAFNDPGTYASSHDLATIQSYARGQNWGNWVNDDTNACLVCHNVHWSQKNFPVFVNNDGGVNTAVRRGNDVTQKNSSQLCCGVAVFVI